MATLEEARKADGEKLNETLNDLMKKVNPRTVFTLHRLFPFRTSIFDPSVPRSMFIFFILDPNDNPAGYRKRTVA